MPTLASFPSHQPTATGLSKGLMETAAFLNNVRKPHTGGTSKLLFLAEKQKQRDNPSFRMEKQVLFRH